jgi:hypothetical protein
VRGICKNSLTPIKIPNLKNMGIEEGEKMKAKGIHNIFKK